MRLSLSAITTVFAVLLSGCGGNLPGAQGPAGATSAAGASASSILHQPPARQIPASIAAGIEVPATIDPADTHAAAYCKQTGGAVEIRRAMYGTNGSSPLPLAGVATFCKYTSASSGASRIYIRLSTLYTTKPSLASLAYIFAPPTGSCQGNPASCYCSLLGGSDQFGGDSGNGGGWFKKNSIDQVLEACIFPDMSSIDSWGLAYHANGIIRGIDLTTVMRYKYP